MISHGIFIAARQGSDAAKLSCVVQIGVEAGEYAASAEFFDGINELFPTERSDIQKGVSQLNADV